MNTKGKKTIKIIVNTLLWIFLVFALAMTIFAFIANSSEKEYPVIGDKCLFCVESDSMDGNADFYNGKTWEINKGFKKGDLIIGKTLSNMEKGSLKVGDVITFYQDLDGDGNKELNTHRIIEVLDGGNSYRTQGDNVAYADDDLHSEHPYTVFYTTVEAIWTGERVAGLGSFIDFFRSSTGFLCCVVIPLAVFFVYELIVLINTINSVKGKKYPKISKEEEEIIKQRAIEEYLAKQAKENKEEK